LYTLFNDDFGSGTSCNILQVSKFHIYTYSGIQQYK